MKKFLVIFILLVAVLSILLYPYTNPKHEVQSTSSPSTKSFTLIENTKSFVFKNKQGLWLYGHHRPCVNIKEEKSNTCAGIIVWVHGYSDHSHAKDHFLERFTVGAHQYEERYHIFGVDLQGFGRSQGDRAYVEDVDHYADDLASFITYIKKQAKDDASLTNLPLFVYGESMGGFTIARFLQNYEEMQKEISGAILQAPALKTGGDIVPAWQVSLVQLLSSSFPKLRAPLPMEDKITRNESAMIKHAEDPLTYLGWMRIRWGASLLEKIAHAQANAHKVSCPLLVVQGGADEVTPKEGSQTFTNNATSKDKTYKEYAPCWHDLHNEPESDQIFHDIFNWIAQRS